METETINFETEMEITILQTAARQSKTTQYLLYRTIDKNPLIRTIFLWDECILITERQCTIKNLTATITSVLLMAIKSLPRV